MSTDHYSYSQIQKYASCPTLYKFHYEDQLVSLEPSSEHDLRFGKAGHAALAVLYSKDGTVQLARKAFADTYPASEYPAQLPHWSPGKSFQAGLAAVTAYAAYWREEDENWEPLHVEEATVDDGEERRVVRLDLIARDRRDGLVYGWDHKWTGRYLNQDYTAAFDPHSQIRQYVDSIQKRFGECGGFYINAISTRHRQKAYTPRTGPDKGVQLPAGDWCDFKRICFNPNVDAIEAERASFSGWVRKIEADRASGQWAYNTDYCVRGSMVCEFHKICSAGYQWPRDRQLIESYYRQQCVRLAADGERCQLEPEHEGDHDSTRRVREDFEIDVTEDIQDAVCE